MMIGGVDATVTKCLRRKVARKLKIVRRASMREYKTSLISQSMLVLTDSETDTPLDEQLVVSDGGPPDTTERASMLASQTS